jgi:hypothetical protein
MRTGWTPEARKKYQPSPEHRAKLQRLRSSTPEGKERERQRYLAHREHLIYLNWIRQIAALGCSVEMYQALLEKQRGVCAICSRKPDKYRLTVDHCHETMRVRGLLCKPCNAGLGCFRDNPELIQTAKEYLCLPPS